MHCLMKGSVAAFHSRLIHAQLRFYYISSTSPPEAIIPEAAEAARSMMLDRQPQTSAKCIPSAHRGACSGG